MAATRRPKARKAGAPAKPKAKAPAQGRALAKPTGATRAKAKPVAPAGGKPKKAEPVSYVKVFLHDRGQDVESFLAAPAALAPPAVLDTLARSGSGFRFTLVHPV